MLKRTHKLLIAALAATLSSGAANAEIIAMEIEANHPLSSAQGLMFSEELTVWGVLGPNEGDLDFFHFTANAGEVLTLDIDGGFGGRFPFDSVIALFDENGHILRANDDAEPDLGSTGSSDSRIENFVVPQTGRYTVGVSNSPRLFLDGGDVSPGEGAVGDYQLVISRVTNKTKQVAITIKPGSEALAPINPKSKGKIPVAILGGPGFDVMSIDSESLTFGSNGSEASLHKCDWTGSDINGDGRVDRVCHFNNQVAITDPAVEEATLRGKLTDGTAFEGTGFLKVVPHKRIQKGKR